MLNDSDANRLIGESGGEWIAVGLSRFLRGICKRLARACNCNESNKYERQENLHSFGNHRLALSGSTSSSAIILLLDDPLAHKSLSLLPCSGWFGCILAVLDERLTIHLELRVEN